MGSESARYAELAEDCKARRRRDEELAMRRRALQAACTAGERAAALCNLADPLAYFGRMDEALQCLREALSLEPAAALHTRNLAAYLVRHGQAMEALEVLGRADQDVSDNAVYWMWRGRASMLLERWADAIAAFRRTVALNPSAEHVWRDLAVALVEAGQYEEAGGIAEGRLRQGLASHLILADIERRLGHAESACALVKTALDAMAGPDAFEEVRWHYCNRRSHLELVAYVRRLAGVLPECPWTHWILARLMSILGDRDAVAAETREVVRLKPQAEKQLAGDPYLAHVRPYPYECS